MPKHAAYTQIEETLAATLRAALASRLADLRDAAHARLVTRDFAGAKADALRFSARGALSDRSPRMQELATTALLFGASRLAKPKDTTLARSGQIPAELHTALAQLVLMVETEATHQVQQRCQALIAAEEEADKQLTLAVRKADNPYAAMAGQLNAAILGTGKMVADTGANLTTSRLASFGFVAEAVAQGIDRYQISGELDKRTCGVCRYLHGKSFDVSQAYSKLSQLLQQQDPKDLKTAAPWPKQDAASLKELYATDEEGLQARGIDSPPFHPLCRCILVPDGTVEEEIPTRDQGSFDLGDIEDPEEA